MDVVETGSAACYCSLDMTEPTYFQIGNSLDQVVGGERKERQQR